VATVPLPGDAALPAEARAVLDEIRTARNTDSVNDFWRALAHDPRLLRATWDRLQAVMAPGALDPLVKEMVYLAVSAANGCDYCVHSHTAAARAKGMTPAMHGELLAVIGMAMQTNGLAAALGLRPDAAFLVGDPPKD
jgi:AhpD family alkylhydroperoxidase